MMTAPFKYRFHHRTVQPPRAIHLTFSRVFQQMMSMCYTKLIVLAKALYRLHGSCAHGKAKRVTFFHIYLQQVILETVLNLQQLNQSSTNIENSIP